MSWNPSESNQIPQIVMQTGNAVGNAISGSILDWKKKQDEERRKVEEIESKRYIADAIMKDGVASGRVAPEEYSQYLSRNHKTQVDMAFGVQARDQMQMERAKLEAHILSMQPKPAFRPDTYVVRDPLDPRKARSVYTNTSGSVVPFDSKPDAEKPPYATLDKEVEAATGGSIADWRNSLKQRVEGNDFVADFPDKQIMDPATGKSTMVKGRTRKVPLPLYQQLLGKVSALDNAGSAPSAMPQQPNVNMGAANEVKRRFKAGELTREDARKQLQALGLE